MSSFSTWLGVTVFAGGGEPFFFGSVGVAFGFEFVACDKQGVALDDEQLALNTAVFDDAQPFVGGGLGFDIDLAGTELGGGLGRAGPWP